jgi:hypothetical protein
MRVLVVGSNHHLEDKSRIPLFEEACTDIGQALAKSGFHLVVGSTAKHTADFWVLKGASNVEGKHKVTVLRPEGASVAPNPNDIGGSGRFEVSYRQLHGPWAAGRVSQILAADCVLMVGGTRGTAQVGHSALALEKAVLAIPCFGGAAEEAWHLLDRFYSKLGSKADKIGNLAQPWRRENAEMVSSTLSSLVKSRVFSRGRLSADIFPLVFNLILFIAWVWLFVTPPEPRQASFFAILAVSAFLGTALRNSLKIVADPSEHISRRAVTAELSAGLVLAFILSLIYLAGSLTFKGDFVAAADLNGYQRVALFMGVLGVTGGWMLESVAQRIS